MSPRSKQPPVPVRFDREEWLEEVERLDERSAARIQAERARREIEAGRASLNWQRCEAEGEWYEPSRLQQAVCAARKERGVRRAFRLRISAGSGPERQPRLELHCLR